MIARLRPIARAIAPLLLLAAAALAGQAGHRWA
jgi:hypothetical protein